MEEDLINGVNPLGRDSKQCYQISSDMIYLLKNGIEANKYFLITPNMCFDQIPIPRQIQSLASWGLPRFATPTQAHLTGLLSALERIMRSLKLTKLLLVQLRVFQGHRGRN